MVATSSNPFAVAIETFIADIKRNEDIRSPFYREVVAQAASASKDDGQSARCAEQLSVFIADLERKQKRESKTLWITDKLRPLVAGLNEYVQACDVIIQAAPSAAILLYGGARLVLHLGQNFYNCFDTLLGIMEEVGHLLKCYELFAQAYQSSADLQSLLVESYKNIVTFWQKASKLLSRKVYKTLLVNIAKPLSAEWQRCREGLLRDRDRVQMLAQATEANLRQQRDVEQTEQKQKRTRKQIVDWIKACEDDAKLDVRSDMRANMDIRYGHSCEWLFEHPDFRAWVEAKKTTSLWYSAPPGAGKTILTSTVVQHLQDTGQKTATFFYSFNDPVRKKPITALRCLALQLLTHTVSIPDRVLQLYEDDVENHCFKLNDLRVAIEVIKAFIKQMSRIHILVDGLDECQDRQQLFDCFCRLLEAKTYGIVKWFFSSRSEGDIRASMQKHNVNAIEAPLDSLLSDIRVYVRAQMVDRLDGHCEKCVEYWTNASGGNFLWIALMLRIMEGEDLTCDEEIDEELGKFPKGLTGCYMRSLAQVAQQPERKQQLARRVFTMVVGAVQPLRFSELSHALATSSPGSDDFSLKRVPKLKTIEELCSNLIVFDRSSKGSDSDPLLKIAHKSVLEFFQQDPRTLGAPDDLHQYFVSPETANLELGQSSLIYLNYARYHQKQDVSELLDHPEHAFLKHAATFWYWYLSHASCSAHLVDDVVTFVKSPAFWSCIAVQSKVAPHLFARYTEIDHGRYQLEASGPKTKDAADRVSYAVPLPMWLDENEPDGPQIVQEFHNFVKEWHMVLNSYPLALDQCVMNDKWDKLMPGRNRWVAKRVKLSVLCQENTMARSFERLVIKDLRVSRESSNALEVALLGLERSNTGVIPQWLHLHVDSTGVNLSDISRPKEPLPIEYTTESELFSRELAWTGSCSTIDLASLRVQDLRINGEEPVCPALETSTRHPPRTGPSGWRLASKSQSIPQNEISRVQHAIALHCTSRIPDTAEKYPGCDSESSSKTSSGSQDSNADNDSESDCSSDYEKELGTHHSMVFVHDAGPPIYKFWKGPRPQSEIRCAFHPTKQVAVWSHLMQELCITNLASGMTESIVFTEPADVKVPPMAAVCKEFHFSELGDEIFYLLYTAVETETCVQQTVSVSSFHFSLTEKEGYLLQRTHPTHTISYEGSGPIQHPLILSSWTSEYVYVALPPLSCNTKVLRLRLPHGSYSSESAMETFETLRDPIFFPYCTPYRDPKLKILENYDGKNVLALTLDADMSSDTPGGKEPVMSQSPSMMSWSIAHQDWRDWNANMDEQSEELKAEKDQCRMLRGTYVDSDKRFNVPIRSGLDWRKKAFLSCA